MFLQPKSIFSWLLLCLAFTGQSQKLRFKQITGEDGLSTNFVRTIIQDDKGFMWFGTQDGLNRYDGYQVKVYRNDPSDTSSLSHSDIISLVQEYPDLLLVGTREGLNYFNPLTEKFRRISKPGPFGRSRINSILSLDSGTVLLGTANGLAMLNMRKDSAWSLLFDDENVEVTSLGKVDGAVYIGTAGRGLWRLGSNNQVMRVDVTIPAFMNIPDSLLRSITRIQQYGGRVYLGTNGAGIFKVDRSFEVQAHISFAHLNPNSNMIRDMLVQNNSIYAATAYGAVVFHLITGETNFYTRQEVAQSLNSNPCNSILADKQNNIWIGTDLGGVNVAIHRSLRFPLSAHNYETEFDNIYAILEMEPDKVVIGGVNVLHEINMQNGKTVDHSSLIGDGTVRCFARENKNVIWVGTWGNGIYRYDLRTGKSTNLLRESRGGTILTLFIDGDYLYAGSAGDGLFRINMLTMEVFRFAEREGLPVLSINCIFRDSKAAVWLGTYDGGLVKLRGLDTSGRLQVQKVYTNKGRTGDLPSNVVFAVNEADNGSLWVATSRGLSVLNSDDSFYSFYEKDGLPNTYLYSLLKDSVGNFWMSSNAGLIRLDPMTYGQKVTFKTYGLKDGLLNTAYHMGAACASKTGLMYFGGPKGFNVFRPTTIKNNFNKPPVFVVGYKIAGRDVVTDTLLAFKKHLELEWSENSFQFELAALDFTDPQKNMFSYQLQGYDSEWSEPGHVRYVSYTELPGGTYKFRVKAANNDGIWNETPYEISISVIPPFWRTRPFYFLVVVLGIAAIYGFTLFRTRSIRRENVLLENKVAERTRELAARNRDITSSIEYAKRIQEAILPDKEQIFQKIKKIFILYRPKDIVSGDFYWFAEKNGVKIFAVVDCTGHGVPGAFMSMIGHNLLDQIVTENGITDPGEILNHLHRGVSQALRQGKNEVDTHDGMDVSLIAINDARRETLWAGANRPLILIDRDGRFSRFNGTKNPVGGAQANLNRQFTTHSIRVEVPTMAYLFSDGYADQFGGERGKKFMVKRFHELLASIHNLHPLQQKDELERGFDNWRQNHEQVDDVLIVGIEI